MKAGFLILACCMGFWCDRALSTEKDSYPLGPPRFCASLFSQSEPTHRSTYQTARYVRSLVSQEAANQKMRRLVRELGRHFPAIRDWEGEARRAEEQGKAAEFYIGVADALMEMPKEDIRKLPSFEARNLVQGFQELAEIYGKQEVRTRIAGFLVIQGQAHEFVELPYGPPTLDTLRLDLIDTTDPQTLPGRIPNAPSPKSEERERTATRPKFFTSDRGLSIFFLTPIDETAGRVSRKKTPR